MRFVILSVVIMSLFNKYTLRLLTVFTVLLISMTALVVSAHHAKAEPGPNAPIPEYEGLFSDADTYIDGCAWISDSNINCGKQEFWYDLQLSEAKGRAIFHYKKDGIWSVDKPAYLYFNASGKDMMLTNSPDISTGGISGDIDNREKRQLRHWADDDASDVQSPAGPNPKVNSKGQLDDGGAGQGKYLYCGLLSKQGEQCYSGRGLSTAGLITVATDKTAEYNKNLGDAIASEETCDADADGALSFIFCPLLSYTQQAAANLVGTSGDGSQRGYLVELLTISPMRQATDSNLYNVWKAFRDLSLGLYILVFIVIIFGNGLGMDSYTIKRTLPRLATAAVLTMASFFIVQTMVDLSNLVGAGLPALISNITAGDANIANFSLDLGAGGSALGILLLIVFSLLALVAVLIGMAGLIFRQIAVYILVIVSPLAFVAWVLPNTESLFKKWWTNMIKLCAMFPIITGMIAMSLLFQQSLNTQTASLPLKLAATLAPLMALIAIPNTFKWGGELFAAGAGFIAGRASKGVDLAKGGGTALKGGVKNMAQNKIIQSDNKVLGGNSKLGGFLAGAGAGSLVNTRGARLKRASKITGVQNEIEKAAGLRYDQAMSTQVDPLAPKEIQAQQKAAAFNKLLMKAPREERFAYAAKAAKSGDANMIGLAANSMSDPREYAQFVNRNYGDFDSQPEFRDHAVARAKGAVVTARAASGGAHTADVANAEANYRKAIRGNGMDATAPGGPDGGKMSGKNSAAISGAKPGAQKEMFYTLQADASGKTVEVVDHNAIRSMDANQVQNLITDKTQRGNLSKDTIQALREHAYVLDAAGKPVIDPATGVAQLRSGTHATAIQQGLDEHGNFK